jgi:general secretion pathway protein K
MNSKLEDEGYTLLIVLWVIVILSVVLVNLVMELQLESFVVKNNLTDSQVEQAEVSGIMAGINQLKQDETEFDARDDEWTNTITEEIGGSEYKVNIKPLDNKLNINYIPYKVLKELDWWTKEIQEKIEKEDTIPDLLMIKDILGDNYSQARQSLTTYGRFNLKNDRPKGLKKLMDLLGMRRSDINEVINHLSSRGREKQSIEEVEDLEDLAKDLSPGTLDELKPYLTVTGRLNINFVSPEMLEILSAATNIKAAPIEDIITHREEEPIEKLEQLIEVLNGEQLSKLEPYLTTTSCYFAIEVEVMSNSDEVDSTLKAVVKRTREDNKWKVEILELIPEPNLEGGD